MNAQAPLDWRNWLMAAALAAVAPQTLGFKQAGLPLVPPIHQDITSNAINQNAFSYTLNSFKAVFTGPQALLEIQTYNASTDNSTVHFQDPEFHFDEDRFAGTKNSIDHLYKLRNAIIAEMRKQAPDVDEARKKLGFALHTVQDFYAHSNWVEISSRHTGDALRHPAFGISPSYEVVFDSTGIVGFGLYGNTSPMCASEGILTGQKDRLTTGYYDLSMSTLKLELGFSTTAWREKALSWNPIPIWDIDGVSRWPIDRCVHGGDTGPGLNKDQQDRDKVHGEGVFFKAQWAATEATRLFVRSLLDGINEPNPDALRLDDSGLPITDAAAVVTRNRGICRLLGHTPESDCDEAAPTGVSVSPSQDALPLGQPVAVTVNGENLAASTEVRMQGEVCPRNPFVAASSTLISVLCVPTGGPGVRAIKAYRYAGAPTEMAAATVTLEIGLAHVVPTVTRLLEEVAVWFSDLWGMVSKVVWSFGEGSELQTAGVSDGTSTTAKGSFKTSGGKSIIAEFLDAASNYLGTTTLTVEVLPATVNSVTAPAIELGKRLTFVVKGTNLPRGLGFALSDCADVKEDLGGLGIGTFESRFTCDFSTDTTAGVKAGAIGVPGAAPGSPFGTVLFAFEVSVPATGVPPAPALFDEFSGTAIDATMWTIDGWNGTGNVYSTWSGSRVGPVAINNGLVEFGQAGRISTKSKVTFSGDGTIVVEGRMAGSGNSRDTSLMLVDSTSGDQILVGDTNYASWGFYAIGMGGYKLKEASTIGDPTNPLTLAGSTAAFMEYRVTLSGDKIKIERGPTLANITQTGTATLGQPIVGRNFHLSIGTAWAYYPGTWDWVRVRGQATVVNAGARPTMVADTGVTSCTDYAFSPFSLDHSVGLDCALSQDSRGDPVPPRQDGATGRDALAARGLLEKIGSGPGGFDFTKLDASGAALPTSATDWACVRDNHTKLVWENKASDGGLRDHRHRYTWYSTAANANGGYAGSLGSNTCGGTLGAACNTQAYVAALNAAQLCGGSGWRLPKLEELRSIANFGRVNPSIDVAWFSNTAFIPSIPGGSAVGFWSSNVYSANPTFGVMGMEFSYGLLMTPIKSSLLAARAVMSDK